MKSISGIGRGFVVPLAMPVMMGATASLAADMSREKAVTLILETVRAFRTAYMEGLVEQSQKAGIEPKKDWLKDDHGIMLPFQFVKLAAQQIGVKDFEVAVVPLTPIYSSNFPRTPAEVAALQKMTANPKADLLTFQDGKQFKGMMGDFAVTQGCADCHNHHPNSTWKDFKQGDLMGALVVRLKT